MGPRTKTSPAFALLWFLGRPRAPARRLPQLFPTCHSSRHPPGKNLFKVALDIIF